MYWSWRSAGWPRKLATIPWRWCRMILSSFMPIIISEWYAGLYFILIFISFCSSCIPATHIQPLPSPIPFLDFISGLIPMPVVDYQVKKMPIQTTIPSSFTEMAQHLAQQNYAISIFIGELFLWCFSYFCRLLFWDLKAHNGENPAKI